MCYPVTADMFENPEIDWLATASSRAPARVEVNIKKLSAIRSESPTPSRLYSLRRAVFA